MNSSGVSTLDVASAAIVKASRTRVPRAIAASQADCMVGPSARGSEKGICRSMEWAPASSMAAISVPVEASDGYPTTTWVMSPLRRPALRTPRRWSILPGMALGLRPEERVELLVGERVGEDEQVLVATAGDIDDDHFVFGQPGSQLDDVGDRVRGLQCWQDALGPGQQVDSLDHRVIARACEADPAMIVKVSQLGADTRVVQARGDAVRGGQLPVVVLQEHRLVPLGDAGAAVRET